MPCPRTESGINDESTLPAAVNTRAQMRILRQDVIFVFFLFINVTDDVADEKTSTPRAIPMASYTGKPRYAMSIGDITIAAEMPARPVPAPATIPIVIQKSTFISIKNLPVKIPIQSYFITAGCSCQQKPVFQMLVKLLTYLDFATYTGV